MLISRKTSEEMKKGSWIRRMFEEGIRLKAKLGPENVFDLSLGNPEIEPPKVFADALQNIVNNPLPGMHRYMPNAGYAETRKAVASHLNKESKVKLCEDDIIMTCGAAGGLNVVLKSLLNAGDEVLILAPYFVEYVYYIDNHGLRYVVAETDKDFMPDLAELDKKISADTRAVIINSPNNPTGAVYNEGCIKGLSDMLTQKGRQFGTEIALILDDAYGKLVYDGAATPCIFNYYQNAIITASFSKILSIPGERIGYVAVNPNCRGHEEIMVALAFCNRILGFVNAPALMQRAVVSAVSSTVDTEIYRRKRDILYNALVQAGYEVVKPSGAFYLFPKTPVADDVAFVKKLLEYHVLAVPGVGFGRSGFMRLSYCVDDKVIEGAIKGLKKAIAK